MSEVKYVSRMIQRRDWNNVCNTLRLMPDAYAGATIKTKHDVASEAIVSVTLLHLALMLNPPLSLVAQFIAIDSSILEIKDTIGRTPLHIAIMHKANPQVLSTLIAAAQKAIYMRADDGSLPIHLAMVYGSPKHLPVISTLLFLYPESVTLYDGHGLSLFDLIYDNVSGSLFQNEVITMLHTTNEIHSSTKRGELPSVVSGCKSFETVSSNSSEEDSTARIKTCIICMERHVSRLLIPCGHAVLCDECSSESRLLKMKMKCPECRQKIRSSNKIFGLILKEN